MTIPEVPSNLLTSFADSQQRITEISDQINQISSVGAQIKQKLIEGALPEGLFQLPALPIDLQKISGSISQLSGSLEPPTIDDVEAMVDQKIKQFLLAIKPPIPELPELPSLTIELPKLEIPSVAEIKLYVRNRIKQLKKQKVKEAMEAQAKLVEEAKTPFSTDKLLRNNIDSNQVILPSRFV